VGISERLHYARKRVGLTYLQVKDRSNIGLSSLSEFENGKREPSLSQLQLLASVYRRSVSFFLSDEAIPEEVVLWREKPSTDATDQEAYFLQLCQQYHNLEVWTNEEISVCLPVEKKKRKENYSYGDAEVLAKRIRDQLELGDRPGLSLLQVLEEICGVKVFHLKFKPTGPAASTKSETFGAAVLLNAKNVRWRRNFDLAHELFHLLTWEVFPKPTGGDKTSSCASQTEEKFASCFAGNLLMPSDAMRVAVNSKIKSGELAFEDLFDIARQFDVSVRALLWRMHNLKLLSGDAEKTEALIKRTEELSSLLEERENPKPSTWPERYRALAIKSLRHGEISIGRFAEYLDITRREAMRYVEQEIMDDEKVTVASA